MSSRNRYLNPEERIKALGLWQTLSAVTEDVSKGGTFD